MLTLNDKTIRMPKALWDKWEAMLLDPETKQGVGALCDASGGYCCLGVLQKAVDGDVEKVDEAERDRLFEEGHNDGAIPALGSPALTPSPEWLARNGITFRSRYSTNTRVPEVSVKGTFEMVSELNDEGSSFAEIVELMRPHVETY
jgi:hypothetical protein